MPLDGMKQTRSCLATTGKKMPKLYRQVVFRVGRVEYLRPRDGLLLGLLYTQEALHIHKELLGNHRTQYRRALWPQLHSFACACKINYTPVVSLSGLDACICVIHFHTWLGSRSSNEGGRYLNQKYPITISKHVLCCHRLNKSSASYFSSSKCSFIRSTTSLNLKGRWKYIRFNNLIFYCKSCTCTYIIDRKKRLGTRHLSVRLCNDKLFSKHKLW